MSLNVSLPAEIESYLAEKVQQGEYASRGELISEGVRLVQQREAAWKKVVAAKN